MINTIENFPLPVPPVCDSNNTIKIFTPPTPTKKIGVDFFPKGADLKLQGDGISRNILKNIRYNIENIPETFTWLTGEYDIMSPPDQGECGSCWAVSSTSVLSDRYAIKYKIKNPILSAANTITCASWFDYTEGCLNGGRPSDAGKFFETKGVKTEKCLPYIFSDHSKQSLPCLSNLKDGCCYSCCSQGQANSADFVNKYYAVPGSTQELYVGTMFNVDYKLTIPLVQKEIMANGPVVGSFMVYKDFEDWWGTEDAEKSIYVYDQTSPSSGGHAVVIVGWGVGTDPRDPSKPLRYWIVRNSWGVLGGYGGYFRMAFSTDIPQESRVGLDSPYFMAPSPIGVGGVTTFLPGLLPGLPAPEVQSPISITTIIIIVGLCAVGIIVFLIMFYLI